jgi:chromosome segregation and condensation protein ScpB
LITRTDTGKQNALVVTPALLAHLGISSVRDLPEYATVLDTLERFEKELQQEQV